MIETASRRFAEASARGLGRENMTAIIKLYDRP
jgi:hypothetical protein